MNFRREGNESSGVHSSDPLLESERSKIVVKYKCPLCRHVMAIREVLHAEYGQLLCPKCVTRTTSSVNNNFSAEEMEQFDTRNGQANPVDDYQPLQLQELDTEEASGYSICNGGDGNALPPGEQVELVNRMERTEHQPFFLQECGIQVNVLSVPIQETELYRSQESDSGTCQTLDLGYAWNHPLQEMEQPALRRPRGNYGLLAGHQPSDDGSVNVVSSLGRIQQHIEHCLIVSTRPSKEN